MRSKRLFVSDGRTIPGFANTCRRLLPGNRVSVAVMSFPWPPLSSLATQRAACIIDDASQGRRSGIVNAIPPHFRKRSRSRWNWCSRSAGIRVHDALETVFTMRRNMHSGAMTTEGNQELFIFHRDANRQWKIARHSFSPTNPPSSVLAAALTPCAVYALTVFLLTTAIAPTLGRIQPILLCEAHRVAGNAYNTNFKATSVAGGPA